MVEQVLSRIDIVAAVPGYELRYILRDEDDSTWELSDPEPVIAWRIQTYTSQTDPDELDSITWPILVDELSSQRFVIVDPKGRVTRPGVATYKSVSTALADLNQG